MRFTTELLEAIGQGRRLLGVANDCEFVRYAVIELLRSLGTLGEPHENLTRTSREPLGYINKNYQGEKDSKEEGTDGENLTRTSREPHENLNLSISDEERLILAEVKGIEGWPFDYDRDLKFIRKMLVDFPQVNILDVTKRFAVGKMDKPLKKNSNARGQLRSWFNNAVGYGQVRQAKVEPKGDLVIEND